MSCRFLFAASIIAAVLALPAHQAGAQSLTERATAIEAALAAGDADAAMAQARALHHAVSAQAGFGVREALLTEEPATGFGIYQPRADAVYAPGTPVHGYVEPFGYSLVSDGAGQVSMLFDIDFALFTPEGRQLTEVQPMGVVELTSRSQPLDAFFYLTYNVDGPEGDYVIWTRVTDRPSGRAAEFSLPFTFREARTPARK